MKSLRVVLCVILVLGFLVLLPFLVRSPAGSHPAGEVCGITEGLSSGAETDLVSEPTVEPEPEPEPEPDPMDLKVSNGVTLRQYVDRVIEIALNEPENPVKNGKTKYGELFGAPSAAWCTEFVLYCLKTAEEEMGTSFIKDVYPWKDSAYKSGLWYKRQNRYYERGSDFIPSPGDFILFDTTRTEGYPDHTGYVIDVFREEDGTWYIKTIEGNIPGDKVKLIRSRTLAVDDPDIFAYGSCLAVTPYEGPLDEY